MRNTVPGAASLGKAVAVLDLLARNGPSGLSSIVTALGMPRATAHRLASALVSYGLVDKDTGGAYRLGPRLVEFGRLAGQHRPSLAQAASPVLAQLRDRTGESVQLFVADKGHRICIVSLQSPHSLRTIVEVGAVLPLDKGSAGRILGGSWRDVDKRGWAESVEERERGVASVSAPVYKDGLLIAAVSVSGPVERTSRSPGARYGRVVAAAARKVSAALN